MSKTGWIVLGVCLGLVCCILTGVFLAGRISVSFFGTNDDARSAAKGYRELKNPYAADGSYSVRMTELKELSIDWISGSVTVELTDGDEVRIRETADRAIREADALRYGISGSKLYIQACKRNHLGNLPRKDLVVSLPRSLAERLQTCAFDTVSASLLCRGLTLKELSMDTISGQVELYDLTVKEARFDTVSGDVTLRDCAFHTLRMNSVSALTSLTGTAERVKASSVSGSIQLFLTDSEELDIDTMSGHVALQLDRVPKKVQVDAASALTSISLPKDASCTVKLDSMSGKLLLNMEPVPAKELVLGGGEGEIEVDSMSGDVWVSTK